MDHEDEELRRLYLLDRSSLHASDSFFAVLRKRVSFFDRGRSQATRSAYSPFQPYRPDMVQKIMDICRVYFNWCEARPFRLVRQYEGLDEQTAETASQVMEAVFKDSRRRKKREDYTTPAKRLGLARAPVGLETILYGNWHAEVFTGPAQTAIAA
jgi:hypothetical protein